MSDELANALNYRMRQPTHHSSFIAYHYTSNTSLSAQLRRATGGSFDDPCTSRLRIKQQTLSLQQVN
ncbi:hypothetical protein IC229_24990 [Spirosoma sp. BT702]|uniref:Uncharacterized protein n=1 Tax=Spirosoma profusum TaxID=2771354 RepID=A0A926Y4Y5_9BACT|nr:hypothetical protein [Spirosoma profusum]MBD2703925.1 hypothetical protein [Spirosoma profusum]